MRHGLRMSILFVSGLLHGACSAAVPSGDPAAAGNRNSTAHFEDSAPESDARTGPAMALDRIVISSDRGRVTAELADNDAARALAAMLPITIEMHDHIRQEKTGNLPSLLPDLQRQTRFSAGMLGLWGGDDFVIYYRDGRVPQPGIIVLGRATGDLSIFERPGPVTVRLQRAD